MRRKDGMYNVKVLMDVKDLLEKHLTPKEILSLRTPEGKKKHLVILKDIYHDCCHAAIREADYDGELCGMADPYEDYRPELAKVEAENGYGFGAVKPDQIREEIFSWNQEVSMDFIRLLGMLEELAEKKGFQKMTEMFTACMDKRGRIPAGFFQYPAPLYRLPETLEAVNDRFSYGQAKFVFSDADGISTYIPDGMMERAERHPEDFLILEVHCD